MASIIHCKFCNRVLKDEASYAGHIESKHKDMIIPGMTPRQFVYYLRTGKTHGNCVICKSPTKWNDKTNKYHRFCENPECKEKYKEMFKNRMMDKYGKTCLLDDPEQQKKMLAARKISGIYQWSDRNPNHRFTYTGTYELEFLAFLDLVMDFPPNDIFSPSPHVYYYEYEGKRHFYIPDFFIDGIGKGVEVEIKDGGDNPNTHPKIQEVDKAKEKLKDATVSSRSIPFDYVKIANKENIKFLRYLEKAKERDKEGSTKKIVLI